jgi:hypothetical protein
MKRLKHCILRNTRPEVKFYGSLNHNSDDCIGVIGGWKEHFISFIMSIK